MPNSCAEQEATHHLKSMREGRDMRRTGSPGGEFCAHTCWWGASARGCDTRPRAPAVPCTHTGYRSRSQSPWSRSRSRSRSPQWHRRAGGSRSPPGRYSSRSPPQQYSSRSPGRSRGRQRGGGVSPGRRSPSPSEVRDRNRGWQHQPAPPPHPHHHQQQQVWYAGLICTSLAHRHAGWPAAAGVQA